MKEKEDAEEEAEAEAEPPEEETLTPPLLEVTWEPHGLVR